MEKSNGLGNYQKGNFMNNFKSNAGVTLIELIIVISLIGIIVAVATRMIVFSVNSQERISTEYQIQSDMRIASEVVNQEVRHASAVFMLNQDQYTDSSDLKDGWNYFATSDDHKEIVHYKWDEISGTHNISSLAEAQSGISYKLSFKRLNSDDKVVKFKLDGYLDRTGNPKVTIESMLDALNSVVVDDLGTTPNPAISLAYRSEDIPDPEKIKVAVTLVLDKSGSMGYQMGGGNTDIRIDVMRTKSKELIDIFADMDNVYISLVPFSTYADAEDFKKAEDEAADLKSDINGLTAGGGTNAGDGLRRSYYKHYNFNSSETDRVLNYTILLMDGNPTYYPMRDGSEYYGELNSIYTGGNGSTSYTESARYIENFANNIIKNQSGTDALYMKTFVIGFTGVPAEVTRAEAIANYHTDSSDERIKGMYYPATNSDELEEVFKSIADFILSETWHIYGPID
jgi:prepilin-type N-terminal cleavage/methylation domain-containing protein